MAHLTLQISARGAFIDVSLGMSQAKEDALKGRDVLARCLLVYNGAAGHFALAF